MIKTSIVPLSLASLTSSMSFTVSSLLLTSVFYLAGVQAIPTFVGPDSSVNCHEFDVYNVTWQGPVDGSLEQMGGVCDALEGNGCKSLHLR